MAADGKAATAIDYSQLAAALASDSAISQEAVAASLAQEVEKQAHLLAAQKLEAILVRMPQPLFDEVAAYFSGRYDPPRTELERAQAELDGVKHFPVHELRDSQEELRQQAKEKDQAWEATLRAELGTLRLSVLQERALAAGARAGTVAVAAAMDGTDPMAALVELVVARERAPEKHGKYDDARQCTFQPQLNANSRQYMSDSQRGAIWERIERDQKDKQLKLKVRRPQPPPCGPCPSALRPRSLRSSSSSLPHSRPAFLPRVSLPPLPARRPVTGRCYLARSF
jgi:hypothetical protein